MPCPGAGPVCLHVRPPDDGPKLRGQRQSGPGQGCSGFIDACINNACPKPREVIER